MLEGWILAGTLDGVGTYPSLGTRICGLPHGERIVHDLRAAGVCRVFVLWNEVGPGPSVAGATTVSELPRGPADDRVIVTRGDRICHRDLARLVASATGHATLEGHDAVFATDRATAHHAISRGRAPRGLALALAELCDRAKPLHAPLDAFSVCPSGPSGLRHAEEQLLRSVATYAHDAGTYARVARAG